jgi:hypothetical protein
MTQIMREWIQRQTLLPVGPRDLLPILATTQGAGLPNWERSCGNAAAPGVSVPQARNRTIDLEMRRVPKTTRLKHPAKH